MRIESIIHQRVGRKAYDKKAILRIKFSTCLQLDPKQDRKREGVTSAGNDSAARLTRMGREIWSHANQTRSQRSPAWRHLPSAFARFRDTANASALAFAEIVTSNIISEMFKAPLSCAPMDSLAGKGFTYTDDGIPRGIFGPLIQAMILLFRLQGTLFLRNSLRDEVESVALVAARLSQISDLFWQRRSEETKIGQETHNSLVRSMANNKILGKYTPLDELSHPRFYRAIGNNSLAFFVRERKLTMKYVNRFLRCVGLSPSKRKPVDTKYCIP
jgi:hypothetical protein